MEATNLQSAPGLASATPEHELHPDSPMTAERAETFARAAGVSQLGDMAQRAWRPIGLPDAGFISPLQGSVYLVAISVGPTASSFARMSGGQVRATRSDEHS